MARRPEPSRPLRPAQEGGAKADRGRRGRARVLASTMIFSGAVRGQRLAPMLRANSSPARRISSCVMSFTCVAKLQL
jgi:hypothetical protein